MIQYSRFIKMKKIMSKRWWRFLAQKKIHCPLSLLNRFMNYAYTQYYYLPTGVELHINNLKKRIIRKEKKFWKLIQQWGCTRFCFTIFHCNGEEFDGKSLLEYIDSQNVRLTRQREELIDLFINQDCQN